MLLASALILTLPQKGKSQAPPVPQKNVQNGQKNQAEVVKPTKPSSTVNETSKKDRRAFFDSLYMEKGEVKEAAKQREENRLAKEAQEEEIKKNKIGKIKKKRAFFRSLFMEKDEVAQFEEKKRREDIELVHQKAIEEKVEEEQSKNRLLAEQETKKRNKEIRRIKKIGRLVEVSSNEEDPVYISEAAVLKAKTSFLKVRDVELKYKVKLQNQTPKIVTQVLLVWERKIPFTESLTIGKEVRVSNPILPYELRKTEYNETDSKREGETYRVKISKIIFEDGTEWKNPKLNTNKVSSK